MAWGRGRGKTLRGVPGTVNIQVFEGTQDCSLKKTEEKKEGEDPIIRTEGLLRIRPTF